MLLSWTFFGTRVGCRLRWRRGLRRWFRGAPPRPTPLIATCPDTPLVLRSALQGLLRKLGTGFEEALPLGISGSRVKVRVHAHACTIDADCQHRFTLTLGSSALARPSSVVLRS